MNEKIRNLEAKIAAATIEAAATTEHIDTLNELSWETKFADAKRALHLSHLAHELSQTLSYTKGLAYSLRNSAGCHWLLADYHKGLTDALDALRLFEETEDAHGRAHALNIIGNTHERLGNHSSALEFHFEALQLRRQLEDREGAATSLNNLGNVYCSKGEYANSLDHYLQSLKLYEEIGSTVGLGRALNNIGNIYRRLGEYDQALTHLLKALSIKQEIGDKQNEGHVLLNIGDVYENKGDYDSALRYYLKSFDRTRDAGDRQAEAAALSNIGNVYRKLGEDEKAQDYFARSLRLARQVGIRYFEVEALINLGETHTKLKESREALAHLTQAFQIASELGASSLIYRTHRALSESYEEARDFARALFHQKAFQQSREQAFADEAAARGIELAHAYQDLQEADRQKASLIELLQQQTVSLDRQTKEDSLTELYNRRYLDLKLSQEFERARRFKRELTVAMADLDNFKSINDLFSHQVGDEVLRQVARILRSRSRKIDTIVRYGGEEFVMLFVETSAAQASVACEKIRQAVEEYDWQQIHPSLRVTISIGLSNDMTLPNHVALLSDADARLYEAKQSGKNRVHY